MRRRIAHVTVRNQSDRLTVYCYLTPICKGDTVRVRSRGMVVSMILNSRSLRVDGREYRHGQTGRVVKVDRKAALPIWVQFQDKKRVWYSEWDLLVTRASLRK